MACPIFIQLQSDTASVLRTTVGGSAPGFATPPEVQSAIKLAVGPVTVANPNPFW